MQNLDHELHLDIILEFLNEELNAGFKRGGIMKSASGMIEMTFHDRIKNYYALVINDYNLKNRAEITERINLAIRLISNTKRKISLYLIFNCNLTNNDLKYFSNAFPGNPLNIGIYDKKRIKDLINNNKIDKPLIEDSIKNQHQEHDGIVNFSRTSIGKSLDFDHIAKQVKLADNIRNTSKSFWWINASKQFFKKQPINQNDIYQYPIRINNGRRRANFSSLKIGDLLIGYDARGSKEIYSILCVIREDDSFVFLRVVYLLDKPISWKQVSEIESYSNSLIIRGKATITLNKLSSDQFIDILLKGISDPDKFSRQVMKKESTSFNDEEYFEVNNNILDNAEDENEDDNQDIELNLVLEKNNPSIASFSKDTPDGIDYLDIQEDIDSFSKVMALKDLPTPLSIALFGAWGSGKSFFMNKLQERIQELTDPENPDDDVFCKNIIHIKFNAWAYLDANLWASLASIIFEQMYNHLKEISKADLQIQHKVKEVTDKLDLIKDEKQRTLVEIDELKISKTRTEKKIELKKQECNNLVENIQSKTMTEVTKKVFSEIKVKEKIDNIISDNNLSPFIHSSSETYSELIKFTNELEKIPLTFPGIFTKRSVILLTIISLIILGFFISGFFWDFSLFNKKILIIPELIVSALLFVTPILIQISSLIRRIRPAVSAINKIKFDVEDQIQSEIKSKEREIEKEKLKMTFLKSEIASLEIKSVNIESKIHELKGILDKGIFFETFKSTINDIHSSKAYKKHLGIISQLKNDFELLSELFIKQLPELNTNLKDKKFVDRIILYLDDLDRCSEEHVIAVLEAVNLLLAYPLFVVVVGVDHRWVKNALITKHHQQFGPIEDLMGYEKIEPSSYLEKIFQIPFHLNSPKKENVKYMISKLVERNENQSDKNKIDSNLEKNIDSSITLNNESAKTKKVKYKKEVINNQLEVKVHLSEDDNKMLVLNDDEIKLLPEFDFILGTNPRTIKRYVNIYRIVRAHGNLPHFEDHKQQAAVCMFLVALAIGECKSVFHKLSKMWHDDISHFRPLNTLFDNEGIENKMRHSIETNNKIKFLLDLDDSQVRMIGLFVERFSFKNYTIKESKDNSISLVD